jgi:membrane protease YdiL (CAAX protease family)
MNPLGPLMAAPIVIGLTQGKQGLKDWWHRITRFRAPVWVYALSVLVPAGIIFASLGLSIISGGAHAPTTGDLAAWSVWAGGALFLVDVFFQIIAGPLPEEAAFRGHGQNDLQKTMSPLMASFLIGIGVAIWHIPLLLQHEIPWVILVVLPAVSIVYGWLYQNGKSVMPLILLHLTQNVLGGNFVGQMLNEQENMIWLSFLTASYIVLAIGLAWRYGPSLIRKPRSESAPTIAVPQLS